jgi:hypothetical protein
MMLTAWVKPHSLATVRDIGFRVASKTHCRTLISPSARYPKPTAAIIHHALTLTGLGQSGPGKAVLGAGRVGAKAQADYWVLSAGNNNGTIETSSYQGRQDELRYAPLRLVRAPADSV